MANDIINGRIRLEKQVHGWKVVPSVKASPSKKYDATIMQSAPAHYNYMIKDEAGTTLSFGTMDSLKGAFAQIRGELANVVKFAIFQPKALAFQSSISATSPQAVSVTVSTVKTGQIAFTVPAGHSTSANETTSPAVGTLTISGSGAYSFNPGSMAVGDTAFAVIKITDTTTGQSVNVTLNFTIVS